MAGAALGNRARRRALARGRGDGSRLLFHGTAGVLADGIRREGLRPGRDGRIYLTDSAAQAQRYAMWGAALVSSLSGDDFAIKAAELGADVETVAAVAYVRVPKGIGVAPEHGSTAPPLPWETSMVSGQAFYVEAPLAARHVGPFELFHVDQLEQPGMREIVAEESGLIAAAFRREDSPGSTAASARGRLADALPDPLGLATGVIEASPGAASPWHGWEHWLGVAAAGVRIIEAGCPADPAVVLAFALFHDSQRHAEGHDPEHGARAADLARRLAGDRHQLDVTQLELLCAALIDHDRGLTSPDPTIGACWDADRLTLRRLGIAPDPALLSTAAGRELAGHPARVPDECDWSWVVFRYQLAPDRSR